jgi:hypothetical protein
MSSIPGIPGSLGLPSGNPTGFPSGHSDASFDVPSGDGPITLANRTYHLEDPDLLGAATSGSFTIPVTEAGNLLVIFVTNTRPWSGPELTLVSTALSDNAADVFTQVPWYSVPGSGSSAGYQTALIGFDPSFPDFPYSAQFDAWYAVTQGGATTINWAINSGGSGLVPKFSNPFA